VDADVLERAAELFFRLIFPLSTVSSSESPSSLTVLLSSRALRSDRSILALRLLSFLIGRPLRMAGEVAGDGEVLPLCVRTRSDEPDDETVYTWPLPNEPLRTPAVGMAMDGCNLGVEGTLGAGVTAGVFIGVLRLVEVVLFSSRRDGS